MNDYYSNDTVKRISDEMQIVVADLHTLREFPVNGLSEDSKRKDQYNSLMGATNVIKKKFQELAKKFQHDE